MKIFVQFDGSKEWNVRSRSDRKKAPKRESSTITLLFKSTIFVSVCSFVLNMIKYWIFLFRFALFTIGGAHTRKFRRSNKFWYKSIVFIRIFIWYFWYLNICEHCANIEYNDRACVCALCTQRAKCVQLCKMICFNLCKWERFFSLSMCVERSLAWKLNDLSDVISH